MSNTIHSIAWMALLLAPVLVLFHSKVKQVAHRILRVNRLVVPTKQVMLLARCKAKLVYLASISIRALLRFSWKRKCEYDCIWNHSKAIE